MVMKKLTDVAPQEWRKKRGREKIIQKNRKKSIHKVLFSKSSVPNRTNGPTYRVGKVQGKFKKMVVRPIMLYKSEYWQ